MTKKEALELITAANAVLGKAYEEREEIGGAVNWADLQCVDVQESLVDGLITITLEEADHTATALCTYVHEGLKEQGYDDIVVKTEW